MVKLDLFKFYKNKKVLVTGHTGFKGSWLILFLNILGAKVYGISDKIPTQINHFKYVKKSLVGDYRFDLSNLDKANKIINEIKPDIIFHLAAQALVIKSYNNPIDTYKSNALATLNILESSRNLNKNLILIMITSDKVYKNIEQKKGYLEKDLLGGKDPYSSSKVCAETIINSYIESYYKKNKKIKIAVARAGNVIGGGDWSNDRIVPDCIKNWIDKKCVNIRNPNSTRPWQHVLEPLNGYLILAYMLKKHPTLNYEKFNFGPSNFSNYSVKYLVTKMSNYWDNSKINFSKNKLKIYESSLLKINSSKAKNKLNWKSKLNIQQTIDFTMDWYLSFNYNKKLTYNKSKEQILKFLNM